jgi:hypothetical protein
MLSLLAQGGGYLRNIGWACIARRRVSGWWILRRALAVRDLEWVWVTAWSRIVELLWLLRLLLLDPWMVREHTCPVSSTRKAVSKLNLFCSSQRGFIF